MQEPRPLRRLPEKDGLIRIGKVVKPLAKNQEKFTQVPARIVDDPEKIGCIVPPPVTQSDDLYICERCHMDVSVSQNMHGWFRSPSGKPEACPACSKPVIRARNQRKADAQIKILVYSGSLLDAQNLPANAFRCSLAKYPGDQTYLEEIQKFIDGKTEELFLTGKTGRGKTGLAISAVHELWKKRKQVLFMPMERYLDLLKENFADGAQPNHIKMVMTQVEYLILDDLGAGSLSETSTGFTVKETQDLIEARNAAGLHTLITSNMTIEGLSAFWYMAKYERTAFQPRDRLVSRLKGWYKVIEIEGKDLRLAEEEL